MERRATQEGRGTGLRIAVAVVMLLAGCASPAAPAAKAEASDSAPPPLWTERALELPYELAGEPAPGTLVHVRTGRQLTFEELVPLLAAARVIYIGETHDNPSAHRLQARIVGALAEALDGRVAVGMEMFPRSAQPELDRLRAGELGEREWRRLWYESWRMHPDYYAPLFDAIREHGLPIIGLNVDREAAKRLATGESRSEEEAAILAGRLGRDPYQRAMLEAVFAGHGAGDAHGDAMIEHFIAVQEIWDEAMAHHAAELLRSPAGRETTLVIIAGGYHVRYGVGVPRRLFARMPVPYVVIDTVAVDTADVDPARLMDVELPPLPLLPADVVAFVDYDDITTAPKLGVGTTPAEGGIRIDDVAHGSIASVVGLRVGDVLTSADGEPLAEPFDLVDVLWRKAPGERLKLVVRRDTEQLEIDVELTEPLSPH